jgi:hypothetical protein
MIDINLKKLQKLNPDLTICSVDSPNFNEYGRVIKLDTKEIVSVAEKTEMPENGAKYDASLQDFENLEIAKYIRRDCFGQMDIQMGYCRGHANFMNAWEWHTSSEINIAVTDLVLILGKLSDIKGNIIDSSTAKAFLLRKGECVEIYATSLHFCPCEVSEDGFGCVLALPKGTNTPLDEATEDKRLTHKNKWLIAHFDNKAMIENGRVPGIKGANFEIKY